MQKRLTFMLCGIILLLSSFLFIRSWQPDRWSPWSFGDIQTMLAVRTWQNEGFLKTSFLWIPQAYSKITPFFDRPDLQQHAHGIRIVSSSLQEQAYRAYTHYPSWYAFPYGILGKLGIYQKSIYQSFALLLSLFGLIFFFNFLREQGFHTLFATYCVLRMMLTPPFLSYADSLANMPYDDFFRFGFLLLWARYLLNPSTQKFILCFLIYFLSAMTSLDSIPFIGASAVFLTYLSHRKLPLLKFSILVMAPLLALAISFLQNASYLGLNLAIRDWSSTFLSHSRDLAIQHSRLEALWILWKAAFGLQDWQFLSLIVIGGMTFYFAPFPRKSQSLKTLILFGICGSLYSLIFPSKSLMAYQPRQLLPFVAVFVASFLLAVFESARLYIRSRQLKYIPILLGGMISILFFKILYTDPLRHSLEYHLHDGFTLRVPVETKFKKLAVDLGAELRGDKVLIQVGEYFPAINRFLGHAQVHPAIEFYFDGPVLSFQDLAELKRDILTLQSLPFDSTQLVLFFPKQLNSQIRKLLDYKKIHWKPWKSFNDHESLIAIVHGNARD